MLDFTDAHAPRLQEPIEECLFKMYVFGGRVLFWAHRPTTGPRCRQTLKSTKADCKVR